MASEPAHLAVTYDEVHRTIRASAEQIKKEFNPDMLIAIGAWSLLAAIRSLSRILLKGGGSVIVSALVA